MRQAWWIRSPRCWSPRCWSPRCWSPRCWGLLCWGLLCWGLLGCNRSPVEPTVGSETHWLQACDADANCGEQGACICGICTAPCGAETCAALGAGAICVPAGEPGADALCGALPADATGICAQGCAGDADCQDAQRCLDGVCVPAPAMVAPARVTQRTSADGPPAVDLLFVIDDSGSMCQEQDLLGRSFGITDRLIEMDFRVAVTSTDFRADAGDRGLFVSRPAASEPSLNCVDANDDPVVPNTADCDALLGGLADPALVRPGVVETSDQLQVWLRCLVTLGTAGDGFEKGIAAAVRATACDGPNAERFAACCGPDGFDPRCAQGGDAPDFLRPEASLVVVFVSDENDCTAGEQMPALSQFPVCRSLADADADGVPDGYASHCGGDVTAAVCYANDCGAQEPADCAASLCTVSRNQNSNCEWERDKLVPVDAARDALVGLKRDPAKVAVWSYVGGELRVESGEPIRFEPGEPAAMCADVSSDVAACCPDGVCLGPVQTICGSPLGEAFSGYRYADLARGTVFGCGPDDGCALCSGRLDLEDHVDRLPVMRHSGCLTAQPACLVGPQLRRCQTAEELANPAHYGLRAVADGVELIRGAAWTLVDTPLCPSGLLFEVLDPAAIPADASIQLHFSR